MSLSGNHKNSVNTKNMSKFHYFTDEEVKDLDQEFVAMLDLARHESKVPYVLTSGYRTGDENGMDHGIKNSAHMNHVAVDIACKYSYERFRILSGLFAVGFKRIGLGENHIHVDSDPSKPQEVFFIEKGPGT